MYKKFNSPWVNSAASVSKVVKWHAEVTFGTAIVTFYANS
jgi:hypothetical protein